MGLEVGFFMIWGLPYGLASFYDFLYGQDFLPHRFRKLSQLLPDSIFLLWFVIGVILLVVVTLEGAYRVSQGHAERYNFEQDIKHIFKSIIDENRERSLQPNTANSNDEIIGIRETTEGEHIFLRSTDIIQVDEKLGTIDEGGKQTFSGLDTMVGEQLYFHIPKIAYVLIMITSINKDTIEVKYLADITYEKHQAAKLTVGIGPIAIPPMFIPVDGKGLCEQINKVNIGNLSDIDHSITSIQIETEYAVRNDD